MPFALSIRGRYPDGVIRQALGDLSRLRVTSEIPQLTHKIQQGAVVAVNLSVKNVPEALASKLRDRAVRNHRSLQEELMAILEAAASAPLLERLMAIACKRGIDASRRLTREQAHDRTRLRKTGW